MPTAFALNSSGVVLYARAPTKLKPRLTSRDTIPYPASVNIFVSSAECMGKRVWPPWRTIPRRGALAIRHQKIVVD